MWWSCTSAAENISRHVYYGTHIYFTRFSTFAQLGGFELSCIFAQFGGRALWLPGALQGAFNFFRSQCGACFSFAECFSSNFCFRNWQVLFLFSGTRVRFELFKFYSMSLRCMLFETAWPITHPPSKIIRPISVLLRCLIKHFNDFSLQLTQNCTSQLKIPRSVHNCLTIVFEFCTGSSSSSAYYNWLTCTVVVCVLQLETLKYFQLWINAPKDSFFFY